MYYDQFTDIIKMIQFYIILAIVALQFNISYVNTSENVNYLQEKDNTNNNISCKLQIDDSPIIFWWGILIFL